MNSQDPRSEWALGAGKVLGDVFSRAFERELLRRVEMNSEADVKKEVKKILKALRAWYYMPVPTGYGSREVVDFMPITIRGHSIIIETKYGNNTPTKWQDKALKHHADAGGLSLVINEKNVDKLEQTITAWLEVR